MTGAGQSPQAAAPMDFLVIGAQKCATSWLYRCLHEHPQLALPPKKREVEYIGGPLYRERGADWYFGLVEHRGAGRIAGDVSVEYLYDPGSAEEVRRLLPNAKLVAVVRHPLDRAVSAYFWQLRKGLIANQPLDDTLQRALRESADNPASLVAGLLRRGLYAEQLERYTARFSPSQILVVAYDEVQHDPAGVLARIYGFVGADSAFVPPSFAARPKHNTYLAPLIALERLAPRVRLFSRVSDLLNNAARMAGLGRSGVPVAPDLARDVAAYLAADIRRLTQLLASLPASAPATRAAVDGWPTRFAP